MASSCFRRIARPFKICALLMAIIALILIIVSLAGPDWVSVKLYSGEQKSWGLWWDCLSVKQSFELCVSYDWLAGCVVMMFLALFGNLATIIAGIVGLCNKWRSAYKVAGAAGIFTMLCLIICMIIYPVKFTDEVKNDPDYQAETSEFLFDWTYGIAWGSVCFLIGATIFFFIRVNDDPNDSEMQVKTKGHEVPPSFYNGQA